MLPEIYQLLTQFLAGMKDAAFDRADGDIHFRSNLFVVKSIQVHLERLSVFFGQTCDCFADFIRGHIR